MATLCNVPGCTSPSDPGGWGCCTTHAAEPWRSLTDDEVAAILTGGTGHPLAVAYRSHLALWADPWVENWQADDAAPEHRAALLHLAARMGGVARAMDAMDPPGLVAATAYIAQGFRVFPVDPDTKRPHRMLPLPGEGPGPDGAAGAYCATDDAEQVRAWWAEDADARVGIALPGLCVVEVEGPAKGGRVDVVAQIIRAAGGDLPRTLTSRSPSGGLHLWFGTGDRRVPSRLPLGDRYADAQAAGLDNLRRGPGLYVVAPSSLDGADADGREWVRRDPIADLPEWVTATTAQHDPLPVTRSAMVLPPGVAWSNRCAAYCRPAIAKAEAARDGNRHAALAELAAALGPFVTAGECDPAHAVAVVTEAGAACGLPRAEVAGVARWITSRTWTPIPDRPNPNRPGGAA